MPPKVGQRDYQLSNKAANLYMVVIPPTHIPQRHVSGTYWLSMIARIADFPLHPPSSQKTTPQLPWFLHPWMPISDPISVIQNCNLTASIALFALQNKQMHVNIALCDSKVLQKQQIDPQPTSPVPNRSGSS